MQTIRDAANAVIQRKRYGTSIREQIARGEVAYDWAAEKYRGLASADTQRKWRRTHEAREAGWLA